MRPFLLIITMLLCVPASLLAQGGGTDAEQRKYLVLFTDKANTPYTLQQPQAYLSPKALDRRARQKISLTPRDLPVDPSYVSSLKQQEGVQVWYTSKWFNGAVVQCTAAKLTELQRLPYIRSSQQLNRTAPEKQTEQKFSSEYTSQAVTATPLNQASYGPAFHQANMLGVVDLHQAGYRGEGMTIAVLDAGFPGVNNIPAFAHLYQENRLKGTFDFVTKKPNVYTASSHGTSVLSTMAAFELGRMVGTAYAANYYLFRTEDAATEHHIEEINWLLAAEYADSAGVDIINSSLGYTNFDAPSVSYTYNDMDGNTALVSKAADFAAATGMLVVVSAGNAGAAAWRYIAAPADADSVLTVGAVDSLGVRAGFSSVGPTADNRIKPDVVAMGVRAYMLTPAGSLALSNGTSFSAPLTAGMAACLWQAHKRKTNMEMIQLIRQIGSNAASPNPGLGYGIPNYVKASAALPRRPATGGLLVTNPVTGNQLELALGDNFVNDAAAAVHIFDATGKLVFRSELPPNQQFHLLTLQPQALKQGVYLCRVVSAGQTATVRFIKL